MAGSATAALAATLAERLKPACLAMCGVCAGHPTDTELGDVVLADRGTRRTRLSPANMRWPSSN